VRLLGYEPREAIGRTIAPLLSASEARGELRDVLRVQGLCRRASCGTARVCRSACSGQRPRPDGLGVTLLLRSAGERAQLARRLEVQSARLLSATNELRETEERFIKSFHGNPAGLAITRLRDSSSSTATGPSRPSWASSALSSWAVWSASWACMRPASASG